MRLRREGGERQQQHQRREKKTAEHRELRHGQSPEYASGARVRPVRKGVVRAGLAKAEDSGTGHLQGRAVGVAEVGEIDRAPVLILALVHADRRRLHVGFHFFTANPARMCMWVASSTTSSSCRVARRTWNFCGYSPPRATSS